MAMLLEFIRDGIPVLEQRIPLGRTVIGRSDACDVALPDEKVSRTHCLVERDRTGEVRLVDRSRHGTFLNGKRVERSDLHDGDRFQVGGFSIIFHERSEPRPPARTAPVVPDASHEQLLSVTDSGVAVVRLSLCVVGGPAEGREVPLKGSENTVGSGDSPITIDDPSLVTNHFRLLVHQGRAMVAPRNGAVNVDQWRVRDLFPLYSGEMFTAGESRFKVVPTRDEEQPESNRFHEMIGESAVMRKVFGTLRRVAGHHQTVLVSGESGTGKELAARGLHMLGPRAEEAFVPVNSGAITETLFESELFGHEKGAFTGAESRRDGAFHQADGGTLFLDEVGEIPLSAQAKLLRALESGEVRRVGSAVPSFPDVRVVAATNRNLVREVAEGRFREDLYFRLAVLTLRLPPLREHPEDIEPLCRVFCSHLHPSAHVTPEAVEVLKTSHTWPGNVRELRNVLTRAFVLHGPVIEPDHLTFAPLAGGSRYMVADADNSEASERAMYKAALARNKGNRAAAARELGFPRTTFLYKLRRLGLDD